MAILFLDANILFSITLTDVFLSLHEANACQVAWSTYVEDEAERNVLLELNSPDGMPALRRRFATMRRFASEDVSVLRIESSEAPATHVQLPDKDDVQVVTDAAYAKASAIVTYNLDDFPSSALAPLNLQALSPDELLLGMIATDAQAVLDALERMRTRKRNPPLSQSDIIDRLRRSGCSRFAEQLKRIW